MRMLHWRRRHARKDKINNECIRGKGVEPIEEKMLESHLRWFGPMRRRPM